LIIRSFSVIKEGFQSRCRHVLKPGWRQCPL
jgi:hypothetical protein